MKKEKVSPAERAMLFEIDPEPIEERPTALGGLPLLVQAFGSLEVGASVKEYIKIRQRDRGYDEPTMVESLVLLNGAGRGVPGGLRAVAARRRVGGTDRSRISLAGGGAAVPLCVS
jgi:hypothetical protein